MKRNPDRVTESQIGEAVLRILSNLPNGEATITYLKQELPQVVKLSAADRKKSTSRTGEELWHQQVGNLVSHRHKTQGNIIYEGLVTYSRNRLKITSAGFLHLKGKGFDPNHVYSQA